MGSCETVVEHLDSTIASLLSEHRVGENGGGRCMGKNIVVKVYDKTLFSI